MIKMIVSDMDGTLLNSNKQLPDDFAEVYGMLRDEGIRFVVASGRQYYTLVDEFAHLNHDISFIAENGGFIQWGEQSKVMNAIERDALKEIIGACREMGVNIVLCGQSKAYVEDESSAAFNQELARYYVKRTLVDDLTVVTEPILKIAINDFERIESAIYPLLKTQFGESFQISTSSPIWIDVMPVGTNKGKAIQFLQKELNVLPEETMAFGDYLNDLEMLQSVTHSYAMGNAHPDIKATARFRTLSNDEDGVLVAIRQHLLQLASR